MKIVQLITSMDTVGGAQIHVRDIAIGMKKLGHSVVLVSGEGKNIHTAIDNEGILHYRNKHLVRKLNIITDIKALIELRKVLKQIEPDLIAAHSSKAGVIGRIVGWSLGIPTVFTAHGWSFTEGVPIRLRVIYIVIEKVAGLFSDGVITVSDYDYLLARKNKIIPAQKLYTIHNGVHDSKPPYVVKKGRDVPIIIMVARFAVPKKQIDLLKALQKLQSLKWRIRFVGDGPLLKKSIDYVKEHGLSQRVEFLGNRKDVEKLLMQSDLFILLSDWEGLPLSILEAMRSGLPVIASDVGGVKEVVLDSVNGYLIPENAEGELIRKVKHLLANPKSRLEMGKESRRIFETNFTFSKMLDETDTYYEKILENKRGKLSIPRRA
ncbi:glycosyltransferase family 4 protein [Sporosarcina sp. Marseille-Q4063]|uniref:glycosyltransferase family 4 protein n=1 Tax=Sporosarcina sp. Marseille-Q4063 TaxID=2810514 RepID=UPI001BB0C649|nr:glycosyltransferase family 4 protein [Sporosarcina sp. Marseille-Q4063]QUW23294.1 glycosyltransferase family 4 protein [Sporosarcina sp. Marseille-Q4063]